MTGIRQWRKATVLAVLVGLYPGFLFVQYLHEIQFNRKLANTEKIIHAVSCGEICSYTSGVTITAKFYPFILKKVNCENILQRLVKPPGSVIVPPPKDAPMELIQEYTQNDKCPIKGYIYSNAAHYNESNAKKQIKPDYKVLENMRDADRRGKTGMGYSDSYTIKQAMLQYKEAIIGKRGLVVGTLRPWLEAQLLNIGAEHITTSEYAQLNFVHPKVTTITPYKLGELFLLGEQTKFDFAASFSSVEHSGLGRYGDPLNPYGDLEAVAQVWCMLKPGAYFFLAVPGSPDDKSYIVWNVHRIYGSERLQHLTANFDVLYTKAVNKTGEHIVMVLKKDHSIEMINTKL